MERLWYWPTTRRVCLDKVISIMFCVGVQSTRWWIATTSKCRIEVATWNNPVYMSTLQCSLHWVSIWGFQYMVTTPSQNHTYGVCVLQATWIKPHSKICWLWHFTCKHLLSWKVNLACGISCIQSKLRVKFEQECIFLASIILTQEVSPSRPEIHVCLYISVICYVSVLMI